MFLNVSNKSYASIHARFIPESAKNNLSNTTTSHTETYAKLNNKKNLLELLFWGAITQKRVKRLTECQYSA